MVGKTLSHYRVLEELGRGGMGIVYKAEDTRLHRLVAIKVMPARSLSDKEVRSRFYQEARAAAGLSHPNIAVIHEISEASPEGAPDWAEPVPFIAMEFVPGRTLDTIIDENPLSIREAVRIASQIAGGLAAAHQNNVVHRDIKCANVVIDETGRARILDFGLAQIGSSSRRDIQNSSSGTVAYMSPEQARGGTVDHRTDLWSLGVVMYEMLAGHPPFRGNVPQAVHYSILTLQHDPLRSHRPDVPHKLEQIVNKLLAKFPNERYQTASETLAALDAFDPDEVTQHPEVSEKPVVPEAAGRPIVTTPQGPLENRNAPVPRKKKRTPEPRYSKPFGLLILVVVAVAALFVGRMIFGPAEPERRVIRLSIHAPDVDILKVFSVSPDGAYIAASGTDTSGVHEGVFLYETDSGKSRFIPGSENFDFNARFSPDSRWIALFGGTNGVLKAASAGGTPVALTDRFVVDGDWLNDNELVLNEVSRLTRISADGGEAAAFSQDSTVLFLPWGMVDVLPDRRNVLVTARATTGVVPEIGIVNSSSGSYTRLLENAHGAVYVRSNHILYTNGAERVGPIYAHAFDPRSLRFESAPLVLDFGETNRNSFAISENGILVRRERFSARRNRNMKWIDDQGNDSGDVPIPLAPYGKMKISPEGTRLVVELFRDEEATHDLLIFDLGDHRESRLTFTGENIEPTWTPDGAWIMFTRSYQGLFLVRKRADGSGVDERIDIPDGHSDAYNGAALSADGTRLAMALLNTAGDGDIDIHLVSTSDPEDHRELSLPGRQQDPSFSLDGRFLAFESDGELFVHDVDGDSYWVVSGRNESITAPVWSHDGRYIYYQSGEALKRSRVTTTPAFSSQAPETIAQIATSFQFALHPDGKRILISTPVTDDKNRSHYLDIVLNWDEELKNLASPDR